MSALKIYKTISLILDTFCEVAYTLVIFLFASPSPPTRSPEFHVRSIPLLLFRNQFASFWSASMPGEAFAGAARPMYPCLVRTSVGESSDILGLQPVPENLAHPVLAR